MVYVYHYQTGRSHHFMIDLKTHFHCLLMITMVIMIGGCTLDDPGSGSQTPPLILQYQQHYSLTELSWTPVRVTGFKEYILLQSSTPIPDAPEPEVNQDVTVLKRINDVDVTHFSASTTLFTPQVCYKLYCAVDDRFLYSASVCVNQEMDVIDGFYDRACHEPGNPEMTIFDRNSDRLTAYNYKTGVSSNTQFAFDLNFPSLEMSTWNTTTHVFATEQSPGAIRKYNFPAMTLATSRNFFQVLWSVKAQGQFLYAATDEGFNNFHIINRSNLNDVDASYGITGNQCIAVFDGDTTVVLTLGQSNSKKYLVNTSGQIIGEESLTIRVAQNDLQNTCAEGQTLFICGREGAIINRNGESLGLINTSNNASTQIMRLTADESKVVYTINRNGVFFLEVADLTHLPFVDVLESYSVPAFNYSDIIVEDQVIYLMGAQFLFANGQTIILKFPL